LSKKVAIIMGSDSDLPVLKPAIERLKSFGVETEVRIMSAHRTPAAAAEFSANAAKNGFGVIIAAAGKAAHLAGALAANTTLPVIGIPVKSSTLDGLDALLSTVQMPKGIPVATVAIDGADMPLSLRCRCWPFQMPTWPMPFSASRRRWLRRSLRRIAGWQSPFEGRI